MSSDYAKCLADPFEGPVSGIVDEFQGKTVTFRVNQTQLLSTPAGIGYTGAIIKVPPIDTQFMQTIVSDAAGTTFVPTSVPLNGAADLAIHYDQYRPVSMGVKVFYTGTESNTAGTVSAAVINGALTIADFPADFDEWFNLPDCHTMACASMTEPLVAICHSFDRPKFNGWVSTDAQFYFPAIGVWGAGLPANTQGLLRMEVSIVLECIPKYGSILTQHMSQVVPHDPNAMATAHRKLPVARVGGEAAALAATDKRSTGVVKKLQKRRETVLNRRRGITGSSTRRRVSIMPMGRRNSTIRRGRKTYRKKRRTLYRRRR